MVVLAWKKDGSLCFCIDFHRLNVHTKKDSYPLLQIQEALESMVGTVHFSTMDFKSGFWQVKMMPKSQQYTTFMVGNLGFYEFTQMPFGLCNVLATFQCLIQNILGEFNLTHCIIYLDDMIVFGHMEEEQLEHLHIMFEWFCEFNLKLKPSKCYFSSQRLYTWCIMFPMRGPTPVRKMCMQWRSSLCQRPSPKSAHFVGWWGITGTSSRDPLTSQGHSMMYWGKLRWAQYSCHPRCGKQ